MRAGLIGVYTRGERNPSTASTIVPNDAMESTYSGLALGRTAITKADKSQIATIATEIQAYFMPLLYQFTAYNERIFRRVGGC